MCLPSAGACRLATSDGAARVWPDGRNRRGDPAFGLSGCGASSWPRLSTIRCWKAKPQRAITGTGCSTTRGWLPSICSTAFSMPLPGVTPASNAPDEGLLERIGRVGRFRIGRQRDRHLSAVHHAARQPDRGRIEFGLVAEPQMHPHLADVAGPVDRLVGLDHDPDQFGQAAVCLRAPCRADAPAPWPPPGRPP